MGKDDPVTDQGILNRPIGRSGIEASAVGLGTWAIGGWMWGGTDEQQSIDAIRASVDAGVSLIDTAPAYGMGLAETIVGKAIAGHQAVAHRLVTARRATASAMCSIRRSHICRARWRRPWVTAALP